MKRPSPETVQKIDFVIEGLENGRYQDLAKQIEFHQRLKGDDNPSYIADLLHTIDTLQIEIQTLKQTVSQLEPLKSNYWDLQQKHNTLDQDMHTIAKAIRQLFEPKPLSKAYDLTEIDQFCDKYGANGY